MGIDFKYEIHKEAINIKKPALVNVAMRLSS